MNELKVYFIIIIIGFVIVEVLSLRDIVRLNAKVAVLSERNRTLKEDIHRHDDQIAYLRAQHTMLSRDIAITKDQLLAVKGIEPTELLTKEDMKGEVNTNE